MTHLEIKNQNSNIEIVNVAIILKLYETALNCSGNVYLKGNLQSDPLSTAPSDLQDLLNSVLS